MDDVFSQIFYNGEVIHHFQKPLRQYGTNKGRRKSKELNGKDS